MMKNFSSVLVILLMLLFNSSAEAVPGFARNLSFDCTTCHTAYPQLTEFGKIFLETSGEALIQKDYGMMSMTPQIISGHIYLLPIDKKFSSDSMSSLTKEDKQLQLRAFDEINAYLTGRIGKVFFFNVFTASSDWDSKNKGGFDVQYEQGFAALNLLENHLNIFGGYASPFVTDGNDTVRHPSVLDRQWEAAQFTPKISQMIGLNGMEGDFYWIAAWQGGSGVTRGNDPKSYSLRAAYSFENQTIGTYFSRDFEYDSETETSNHPASLYGLDGHLRFLNTNILMVLGFRKYIDQQMSWDYSIEANKIFTIKNKKYLTSIIPVANLDAYVDSKVNSQVWVKGSAGIAFYINPGVRVLPQVAGTLRAPSNYIHKDFQFLISADIGL